MANDPEVSSEVSKKCFVISPIGPAGSEIRERSDKILEFIIRPAVEQQCHYEVTRADEMMSPGVITSQIMDRINNDDLVIADLTGLNPNVFYELAVRHAVNKPVIQIMELGEYPPFDVAGMRTIFVDHRSLPSAKACIDGLVAAIAEVERGDAKVISPISFSVNFDALRQSGDASAEDTGKVLSQVLLEMSQQRTELRAIQSELRRHNVRLQPPRSELLRTSWWKHLQKGQRDHLQELFWVNTCRSCGSLNEADSPQCVQCGVELPSLDE